MNEKYFTHCVSRIATVVRSQNMRIAIKRVLGVLSPLDNCKYDSRYSVEDIYRVSKSHFQGKKHCECEQTKHNAQEHFTPRTLGFFCDRMNTNRQNPSIPGSVPTYDIDRLWLGFLVSTVVDRQLCNISKLLM